MQKKFIILFILAAIFIGFFYFFKKNTALINPVWQNNSAKNVPSDEVLDFSEAKHVLLDGRGYSYLYFTVKNPNKLVLIPNFSEEKSTQKIKEENSCIAGINGGFYDEENKPLGRFISEGRTYGDFINSALFNGYLSVIKNQVMITTKPLQDERISLQSGPLLILDGSLVNLSIKNDKYARRSVALITGKNELVFMTVFNSKDLTAGPNLANLPLVIDLINNQEKFFIKSAINLDGGTASAIYVDNFVLSENSHVGSLFCLKK